MSRLRFRSQRPFGGEDTGVIYRFVSMAQNAGTRCTIGIGGFWLSVEAEQLALCRPAERNIADAQDFPARQINRLRAVNNG
jgi:hypothetical protein